MPEIEALDDEVMIIVPIRTFFGCIVFTPAVGVFHANLFKLKCTKPTLTHV